MPIPSKFDGWMRAETDEPTFTLLARDRRAPGVVKQWAYERERDIATGRKPESDREMVAEARRIAKAMETWHAEHRADEPSPVLSSSTSTTTDRLY